MNFRWAIFCFTLIGMLFMGFPGKSAPGDTIRVSINQPLHLNSQGTYSASVNFPATTKTFRKVIMEATLGCPQIGCSAWSYMVNFGVVKDSADARQAIEMGRAYTPYAGSRNRGWSYPWYFDVTDYRPLLKGNKELKVYYRGVRDGFTIDLTFIMIEGTPDRKAVSVEQVYKSPENGWHYGFDTTDINQNHLVPKQVKLPGNAEEAKFKTRITGLGFGDQKDNCAVFCERWFELLVDDAKVSQQTIWRNNCDMTPIYPQTGTWLLSRSNWCPGTKVHSYEHQIHQDLTGRDSLKLEMNFEDYNFTPPGGSYQPPKWVTSAQLITYQNTNFTNDVGLKQIIAPSDNPNHGRFNPTCGVPIVEVKNHGKDTLRSAMITYGPVGKDTFTYRWKGSLGFSETDTVHLPGINEWDLLLRGNQKFRATVNEPNRLNDENGQNNQNTTDYASVPEYPNNFLFQMETNKAADELSYELRNAEGKVVYEENNFSNETTYTDTFNLPGGCYEFTLYNERGAPFGVGDGLDYYCCAGATAICNNEGCGSARFIDPNNTLPLPNSVFEPNFGRQIKKQFTVGCQQNGAEFSYSISGATVQFENTSNNYQEVINWDFGDGTTTDTSNQPVHTYTENGTYEVCLEARNPCGDVDIVCETFQISCPRIDADFAFDRNGLTINFTQSAGNADAWIWDFGDGTKDTAANPTHEYPTDSTYKVCMETFNSCERDSVCKMVEVYPVGITSAKNSWLKVYPTPVKSFLNVQLTDPHQKLTYQILDANGKALTSGAVPEQKETKTIDVSNLSKGIYFIELKGPEERYVKRFVVE